MLQDKMIERIAKVICVGIGYEWDTLYATKSEWIRDRGSRHDINVPRKPDFEEAAKCVLETFSAESLQAQLTAALASDDQTGIATGLEMAAELLDQREKEWIMFQPRTKRQAIINQAVKKELVRTAEEIRALMEKPLDPK